MTSWHFFFIARLLESVVVYTTIIFSLKVFFRTGKLDFFPLYMLRSIVCKGYLGFTAEFEVLFVLFYIFMTVWLSLKLAIIGYKLKLLLSKLTFPKKERLKDGQSRCANLLSSDSSGYRRFLFQFIKVLYSLSLSLLFFPRKNQTKKNNWFWLETSSPR